MNKLKLPRKFVIAALIYNLVATVGYLIAPIQIRYIESLTTDPTTIALIYGVGTVSLAALTLVTGYLADRGHRQKTIFFGLAVSVIYPLLYASVMSAAQYAGIRFGWAVAIAATMPLLTGHIHDLVQDLPDTGRLFGILYAIGSITGAVAQFAGGFIAEISSLETTYVAAALLALVNLVVALFLFRDVQSSHQHTKKVAKTGFSFLFRTAELRFYFVNNLITSINFGMKYILLPLIIFDLTRSDTLVGAILAGLGVTAFFVLLSPNVWNWADTYSPFSIYLLASTFLLAGSIIFGTADSVVWFWLAAPLFALGESISGPAQGVLINKHVPAKVRGRVLAADDSIDTILITFSPILVAYLLSFYTAQGVFLVYGSLTLVTLTYSSYLYMFKLKQR